ncbi:ribonucleotide-diphosphate reductase subunit alpha [Chlorella sorokiniana]|uniref:Ribonucleotide-diphosphate reductase subunit alpha n=1 Tax=Chlorella sorokiniana TaxID=3076 RepID=A0A2P6U0U4_CHLSO|nr:ribonucleotide-diphosphate reductase subunit alpha [Chlorella sorokiniana]|eukprot:PRW59929.1 ribonucleotide-diphosphate reductase subunit alpha [Chlorella sorokiniana]
MFQRAAIALALLLLATAAAGAVLPTPLPGQRLTAARPMPLPGAGAGAARILTSRAAPARVLRTVVLAAVPPSMEALAAAFPPIICGSAQALMSATGSALGDGIHEFVKAPFMVYGMLLSVEFFNKYAPNLTAWLPESVMQAQQRRQQFAATLAENRDLKKEVQTLRQENAELRSNNGDTESQQASAVELPATAPPASAASSGEAVLNEE